MEYDELIESVRVGNIQRIRELLDSGLDINYINTKDENSHVFRYFMDAVNPKEVFTFLLSKGANPSLAVVDEKLYGSVSVNALSFIFQYDRLFTQVYKFDEPKVEEIHNLMLWLVEKETQHMLITKYPILYKTYKTWEYLHDDIKKEFHYLETADQLNII